MTHDNPARITWAGTANGCEMAVPVYQETVMQIHICSKGQHWAHAIRIG